MVNDILGHDVGDEMILESVKLIEQNIQLAKFVIRMGGDEFLVILPNCTAELASVCINNLAKAKSRCEDTIPTVFATGKSLMTDKTSLKEAISNAEKEIQHNKIQTHNENRAVLLSYIEKIKNKKIEYHDTRL